MKQSAMVSSTPSDHNKVPLERAACNTRRFLRCSFPCSAEEGADQGAHWSERGLLRMLLAYLWERKKPIKKNHIKEFGGRMPRRRPRDKLGTSQGHMGHLGLIYV